MRTLKPLPIEAWALGYEVFESEDGTTPVGWLSYEPPPQKAPRGKHLLKILKNSTDRKGQYEFSLDGDFDGLTVSHPSSVR